MQDFRPQQNSRPVSLDELSLADDDAPVANSATEAAIEPAYQSAYRAPAIHDDWEEDEDVVELAGPGQRILARLLDYLPFVLLGFVSAILTPIFARDSDGAGANAMVWLMLLGMLAIVIYQLVIMTRDGQSIGKKIMGIRVITEDGDNPGFVRYVLLREFAYAMILNILGIIPILGTLIVLGATIACLVMLFREEDDRRTLQDKLAKTLVVKV